MYKKTIIVFLLLFSHLSFAQIQCHNDYANNIIDISFQLPHFTIRDTSLPSIYLPSGISWAYVDISNNVFGITDSIGFPELPQLTIDINIPNNAEAITVQVSNITSNAIRLHRDIMPHQIDIDNNIFDTTLPLSINSVFYLGNITFPHEFYTHGESFYVRNKRGNTLSILPFFYNHSTRILGVINSMNITIRYKLPNQATEDDECSNIWEKYYEKVFSNYTANTTQTECSGRYLMIVPAKFQDAISSFMAYKSNLGYIVDTITLLPIDANATTIKTKIQNRYNNPATRPDFILLVGDHENLPAHSGDTSGLDETNPLTDVPYAFLNGNDIMVDAYIGRWPVSNTNELQCIINKTIFMEANMHLFEKKSLFISGDHDHSANSITRSYMLNQFKAANEDVSNNSFIPNGFSSQLLLQPTRTETETAIKNNPLLLAYSGHGNFKFIGSLSYSPVFKIDSRFVEESRHDVFPMMFVFACKTGNFGFAQDHTISENWIRSTHGSVSYWGSSVTSMTNSDNMIERKILGEAFFEEPYLGSVVALGMQKYRKKFWKFTTYYKRYTIAYNLMGDPSFMVNGWGCGHNYWVENLSLNSGDKHIYHAANHAYFINSNEINNGAHLTVTAGNEIAISGEFSANAGSDITMKIEDCHESTQTRDNRSQKNTWCDISPIQSEITNNDAIVVYPSLAHESIYVQYNLDSENDVSIILVDMFGRIALQRKRQSVPQGNNIEKIDVIDLPVGNYFVLIDNNGKKQFTKCIIKY